MTLISILGTINRKNNNRYKKFSKSEEIDSIYQNSTKELVPNLKIFTSLKNIVLHEFPALHHAHLPQRQRKS